MYILDDHALRKQKRTFVRGERILLAYASQTGTAKALAERIYSINTERCDLVDLAEFKPEDLANYAKIVFVVATFGNGDPPTDSVGFYAKLCQSNVDLKQVLFSILALGDRQYLHFCGFGNKLSHQMIQHGAVPRIPLTEVNRANSAVFIHWWSKLGETFELEQEHQDSCWTVATLMEKEHAKAACKCQFTLYIKCLETECADALEIKCDQRGRVNGAIVAPIVSTENEPFTRILLSIEQSYKVWTQAQRHLLPSEPGDKWLVKVLRN